jgi:hypothetical protein
VPTTIIPTTFADGGLGSGSLRDAVLQFNADNGTGDDTIQLLPGTYTLTIRNVGGHHETAGLTGDLNLNQTSHPWIIQGAESSTIIDASQLQDRVFEIVKPGTQVVFQNLVIQGGLAQDDGSDGALQGTTDGLGGGILNNGGNVTLDHVILQNNVGQGGDAVSLGAPGHKARGGGIYSTGGALAIAAATISNNQATGGRGGDVPSYHANAGDGGSADGAGLYATGGALDISNSMIASNRATGGPGGDGTFSTENRNGGTGGSAQGAGLYVNGGALTMVTTSIASNQGTGGDPGLYGSSGVSIGGGLYNSGTLTVTSSTLSSNSGGHGGGIFNFGTLTVSNSTLSGNSGNSTYGYGSNGGGIYNDSGTVTVSNSTLSGDTAGAGGGIANYGTLTLSNSTLSGNSAGPGGGIYTRGTRTVTTLTNVTLNANRATYYGGGLYVEPLFSAAPVLHNTLIAGNFRGATGTTRDDVYGHLDPGGDYNLIGDGTGMTGLTNGVNGNQVGSASDPIDPLLDSLGDYGGPTRTHALLAGSPALNTGNPNQLGTLDQRGVVRTGGVNIGAYQASATGFVLDAPATVTAGVPFDVTVTAVDPFRQAAVGYTGTVTFSTTDRDPGVVLPVDYAFTLDDGGAHRFTDTGRGETTLITAGEQMLTVSDIADDTITGSATVTVEPGGLAPAPDGFPRPSGPGTIRDATAVQTVQSSSTNAGAERFFAALAEEESTFPWLWWVVCQRR